MPIDWKLYPKNWKEITQKAKKRANWMCELCRTKHNSPHPITNSNVIVSTHHINGDYNNNNGYNLLVLCQRCHLRIDLPKHLENRTVNDNPLTYNYAINSKLYKIHHRKMEILRINAILVNITLTESNILLKVGNYVINRLDIDKTPKIITASHVLWFSYRETAEKVLNSIGSVL